MSVGVLINRSKSQAVVENIKTTLTAKGPLYNTQAISENQKPLVINHVTSLSLGDILCNLEKL